MEHCEWSLLIILFNWTPHPFILCNWLFAQSASLIEKFSQATCQHVLQCMDGPGQSLSSLPYHLWHEASSSVTLKVLDIGW